MRGVVRACQSRAELQELNCLAKHDDAWLSIVSSVNARNRISAFESVAFVFVSSGIYFFEGDCVIEELPLIHLTLAAGALHGDLADTGTFESWPRKASKNDSHDDFKQ